MSTIFIAKISLIVSDLERSLRVYRDGLGLTVDFIKLTPAGAYGYEIMGVPKSGRMRFAGLSTEGEGMNLTLTEITGVTLAEKPAIATSALVIHYPAFEDALNRLRRVVGVAIIPERAMVRPDGRSGAEAAFVDPDGHRIVLYKLD